MTTIKTQTEIAAMRESGRMLATTLAVVAKKVDVGVTTKYLADIAAKELKALGGQASFLGHFGFPDVICISINEEIVHGIPSPKRILSDGDIVSLDFGVTYQGMITDGAISMIVGKPQKAQHVRLLEMTRDAMQEGIGAVRNGARTGDVGFAIENVLKPHKYGIPHDLVGHGVGHELWEDPQVPNYGLPRTGSLLKTDMTIAIEPMVTLGTSEISTDADGWTVRTADGSWAAHFEHTVLVLEDGAEILTVC